MSSPTARRAAGQDLAVAAAVLLLWFVGMRLTADLTHWRPLWIDAYRWAGCWLALALALRRSAPRLGFWLTMGIYPVGYSFIVDRSGLWTDLHALPLFVAAFTVTHAGALSPLLAAGVTVAATLVLDLGIDRLTAFAGGVGGMPDLSHAVLLVLLAAGSPALGAAFHRLDESARALTQRNAELRAMQELRAREAVQVERTRIARELHDVLAHHVSAIVVRAQAAERVGPRHPEAYREAVEWIAPAGREALASMRAVVRVLRAQEGSGPVPHELVPLEPLPGLGELAPTIERVRGAGLEVAADLPTPLPAAPAEVGLAVVRVAQESLTNVLIHSQAGQAGVRLVCSDRALTLEVSDPGPPRETPTTPGGGHGIVHMRERAAACGGHLSAGPTDEGHWLVRLEVPL